MDNVRRPSPPSLAAPRASLTPYLVAPPIADHNPHTGRSCAPLLRRYEQHIGGGGAGAHNGEPGGRQGEDHCTPPLSPLPCCAACIRGPSEGTQRLIRGSSGNQRLIRGNQRHPEVISGPQRAFGGSSGATQRHSEGIISTQSQSQAHQRVLRGQSEAITATQRLSEGPGTQDGHDDPRLPAPSLVARRRRARAFACCAIVVRSSRPPSLWPLTTLAPHRPRSPRARAAGWRHAGRPRRQVE